MNKKIIAQEKLEFKGNEGIPATVFAVEKMPDTGSWKTFRPVIDYSKCIKCHLCWLHCPDTAIKLRNDDYPYSLYKECKGCAACSEACPVKCIEMQRNQKDNVERSDLLQFRKEAGE